MKTILSGILSISLFWAFSFERCNAQGDSTSFRPKYDYQIYLKQPGKEIKELIYKTNSIPISGYLSDDKKTIIMKDYEQGSKVHIKILYDDGTEEEFDKSPCFIDPVI